MSQVQSGGIHDRLRRNTMKLAGWTAAWVIALAIATFGPGHPRFPRSVPSLRIPNA